MDSTFRSYYTGFLGVENADQIIFPCKRRAEPFSLFFVQHLIATFLDSGPVISVNPELLSIFTLPDSAYQRESVDTDFLEMIDDKIIDSLNPRFYNIRMMSRMTVARSNFDESKSDVDIRVLNEKDKAQFCKLISGRGQRFCDDIWEARLHAVQEGRYFAAFQNGEIVSTSFISDIDSGGANLVVSTVPEYRKRGFGKAVVSCAVKWCFSNGYLPIYLVDIRNTPSVELAESIGYREASREVIVSGYHGISPDN
ncbi:MAG: GNAT family N-acetyltransferase [Candidatus Sabulitectum sp.]|nr:GNAT family N-acetyltransferase [Candidatus Sabulitectum sp.]